MCEFLKGQNHTDVKRIKELTIQVEALNFLCDVSFSALVEAHANPRNHNIALAKDLYSRLLLARETHDFSEILNIKHERTTDGPL